MLCALFKCCFDMLFVCVGLHAFGCNVRLRAFVCLQLFACDYWCACLCACLCLCFVQMVVYVFR